MPPPTEAFHPSDLTSRIQYLPNGRKRKEPLNIDLQKDCELKEMLQYFCDVAEPEDPKSRIVCEPVLRLFRKYVLLLACEV
jgi:inner membrane protease subunit SOM1